MKVRELFMGNSSVGWLSVCALRLLTGIGLPPHNKCGRDLIGARNSQEPHRELRFLYEGGGVYYELLMAWGY